MGSSCLDEHAYRWEDIRPIPPESAFDVQVGGDHYKHFPKGYQPMQVAYQMKMDAYQFAMFKYMLRDKVDRIEDIDKLIHCAQMYKEELKKSLGQLELKL